ncbi:hypothetical protein nACB1_043 [Acinetobacter phage nACB1]|nr:hypothetical protein nACB1_043 [Acinetobacter phage nACB1]
MEKIAQFLDGLMIFFCSTATVWIGIKALFALLMTTIGGF